MIGLKQSLSVVALGLASVTGAQASVVYNWNPLDNTADFATNSGRLVLSDSAYASGQANFSQYLSYSSVPDDTRFPDSPIERVTLAITPADLPNQSIDIFANPTRARADNPLVYSLDSELTIAGDLLTGSLDLINTFDSFDMTSDSGGLWTIGRFGSDQLIGGACGDADGCGGATGRWELASGSTPGLSDVPAPAVWALFGLGVLGLFGFKRRA